MEFGYIMKRIMIQKALKSRKIKKVKQDSSHKFISILACISVIGRWIPPLLIYKDELGNLINI
jgi:hypothetical protein